MKESVKIIGAQRNANDRLSDAKPFGPETAKKAKAFHSGFPEY